ncbi:hypothetical protein IEE_05475 [Bacillus cereus BAG5X1-1]|uniref:Uncharacterized protein n=1 Tax=Bacillus cereus BAG5X1-1 TaxID=1053189 RepID=J8ABK7_BACCE|nr:hypothetical protein [Bacillus cereus]EJQ35999.1 hypothetical protein IEE_05475 [Bacillus cereus BAG5X1-1]
MRVIDVANRKRIYFEMKNKEARNSIFLIALGYMAAMFMFVFQFRFELSQSYHYILSTSLFLFVIFGIEYSELKRKKQYVWQG